jgi:hypothetical protein
VLGDAGGIRACGSVCACARAEARARDCFGDCDQLPLLKKIGQLFILKKNKKKRNAFTRSGIKSQKKGIRRKKTPKFFFWVTN